MTLYVESNFVLEIALGQEEFASAERLLAAAERGAIGLALPGFSLSESLTRVTRGIRDRKRLVAQFNAQVVQLGRSSPHQVEVGALQAVPDLIATIDEREMTRLTETVERLLPLVDVIELNQDAFREAMEYRTLFRIDLEDAIILAIVVGHLTTHRDGGPHLFANRNWRDFNNPAIVSALRSLGCELAWGFGDALRRLGLD